MNKGILYLRGAALSYFAVALLRRKSPLAGSSGHRSVHMIKRESVIRSHRDISTPVTNRLHAAMIRRG